MTQKQIYLIGSLRNPAIPELANRLRAAGYSVFDDWHYVGPNADDEWKAHEQNRGRTFKEAIAGAAAENTFAFDHRHINASSIGVLVHPAGKSAHLELGYMAGKGKLTVIYFPEEPDKERWDVMVKFAHYVAVGEDDLLAFLAREARTT
jgi:hypothetical protein